MTQQEQIPTLVEMAKDYAKSIQTFEQSIDEYARSVGEAVAIMTNRNPAFSVIHESLEENPTGLVDSKITILRDTRDSGFETLATINILAPRSNNAVQIEIHHKLVKPIKHGGETEKTDHYPIYGLADGQKLKQATYNLMQRIIGPEDFFSDNRPGKRVIVGKGTPAND